MASDPIATLVLTLAIVLFAAKLVGHLAILIGEPAVLGELVAGILLGNVRLLGVHGLEPLLSSEMLDLLARFGVLLLLFEIGLESTIGQMLRVGPSALLFATTGVLATFALGFAASSLLLPASALLVHVCLAATLCATPVGISARVLHDLSASGTTEARIVLLEAGNSEPFVDRGEASLDQLALKPKGVVSLRRTTIGLGLMPRGTWSASSRPRAFALRRLAVQLIVAVVVVPWLRFSLRKRANDQGS